MKTFRFPCRRGFIIRDFVLVETQSIFIYVFANHADQGLNTTIVVEAVKPFKDLKPLKGSPGN